MEETIQQRRSRPYSRAETISSRDRDRITPTNSSNSSSTYLPSRHKKVRESDGASMLHERLRERKVESARQSRRQSIDSASVDYRNFQSSPMKANHSRDDRRPSSSGIGAAAPSKKAMGVKQIEEQVSTLHKQNFDLKLELYHRRERQEKLEARLEAAEARLAEQEELQEVNEQLLAELEKRDQAVEEAVGIICDLEEKVEKLMEEREIVRKFDAQNEAGYFSGNHEGHPSSPPSLEASQDSKSSQLQVNSQTNDRLVRMPSFLSDQSEGAEALKSLYIPMDRGYSGSNLPKLLEDGKTEDGMDSPRLSVLSESSFLSVYGEKPLSLNSADAQDDAESQPQRRHRASSAVEKWVDDRPVKSNTPPAQLRPTRIISSTRKSQLLSINSVLESPLQRLERGEHRLEKLRMRLEQGNKSSPPKQEGHMERSPSEQEKREEKRKSREVIRRMVTDKASFDRQQTLPPTPDTVSTSTLRHYKNSNDTLHERNQAGDGGEAMYLTDSAKFPVPVATHNAYQSMLSMRPRSAGETVTSRREGHGWDTETQDDFTETGSISSTGTYDTPHKSGFISPDLFSFGGQDDGRLWARDVMFNHESAARLPTHKQQPSDNYRLNRAEPRSDQTVTPEYSEVQRTRFNSGSTQSSTSPIDTSPRPDPPARRSSLSAAAKLRKAPPSLNHGRDHSQGSQSPQSKESKRSRFTGLFARSSTSPSVSGKFPNREESSSNGSTHDNGDMPGNNDMGIGIVGVTSNRTDYNRPQNGSRLSSRRGVDDDELDRATPPPIQRSRPTQTYVRPSSAGAGATRKESAFANGFGGEASNDRRSIDVERCAETEEANGKNGNGGGRKWLGKLSRAGSLSKRA